MLHHTINTASNYPIAQTYSIHQKINIRSNALYLFNWNQYEQMMDNNKLCLAPYYNDRLIRQGRYVAYRKGLPQWVKNMEQH